MSRGGAGQGWWGSRDGGSRGGGGLGVAWGSRGGGGQGVMGVEGIEGGWVRVKGVGVGG